MRRFISASLLVAFALSVAGWSRGADMVPAVIEQASRSVYLVTTEIDGERRRCSGFLIADERILTAGHCTGETMTVAGIPATILNADAYYDLALLAAPIHGTPLILRDLPVARFEELVAIGHAYGWQRLLTLHVRVYYVDMTPAEGMRPGLLVKPGYIGGMSGGPVIDAAGQVVGIIQASNHDLGYGIGVVLIRAFLVGLQ